MSNGTSINREIKKDQLRRQVISSPSQEDESREPAKKPRIKLGKKRLRLMLLLFFLFVSGAFGVYWHFHTYQYGSYSVLWERTMNEGSYAGYVNFGSNVLKYSKDGASYINSKGKEMWIQSYEMKSPIACVNGDYAAVGDKQGNLIYIFDKSGNTGVATTVLPIVKLTVSAGGVAAAILEDSAAGYVYFFKQDGSALDVKIKALLGGVSGYPLDISLSPDGTQLIGAYAYLKNRALNGRVAFHNFAEVGKNIPDRLVGGFDAPYDASMVAQVEFLGNTASCAFADNGVSFYSTANQLSPELVKQVSVENEIESVFCSAKYVGLIMQNSQGENPNRLEIYRADGSPVFSRDFQYAYTGADIDGERVILYNENSCRVYTMSGKLKFTGTFDFPVSKVRNGRFSNSLIVTGPQNMKEIRLQTGGQYQ